LDKVIPNYPPYGKRMLVDNGWYQALRRDNVKLVTAPIVRITATGVETAAGHEEADVLAFATGFSTNKVLWPIQVTGRGGVDVRARQDAEPEAYKGMALQDCPNLLMTYGPHGVPAHGGNGMLFAETAVGYITECLRAMFERGWTRLEVKPEAVRAWTDEVSEAVEHYVWSVPGVTSWFKAGGEKAAAVVPRKLVDIWQESKAPDLTAYNGS
jgi:4-hydroxyacetophenone monooxygenase